MESIDANCRIGPESVPVAGREFTADVLKAEMDQASIDKAVVYHSLAREYDPVTGNEQLMQVLAREPRLLPAWVILPQHTGEVGDPRALVGQMLEEKVVIARLFPKDHGFSLSEWSCGALLSTVEDRRMPLMIDLEQTTFDQISSICTDHPDLPLILSDVAYRSDRYIYPLLESHSNLYIETARYQTHRGIESICDSFGPRRLIFSSRTPELTCGPMAMMVRYAKIAPKDKEMILGGNLAELIRRLRG